MDTLSLTDLNLEVKSRSGDRLFYDQYEYGLYVFLQGISSLRELNRDLETAKKNVALRLEHRARFKNYGGNWNASLEKSDATFEKRLQKLHNFIDVLHPYYDHYHLTVASDWGYIYTNNIEMIRDLIKNTDATPVKLQRIFINRPRNTVRVKSSEYAYRTYFKERWVSHESKNRLSQFLLTQEDIELSPSLKKTLTGTSNNTGICRYHYFNHNNPVINTMIELVVPGLVRTTMPVLTK